MAYLSVYWKRYWKLFIAAVAFLSVESCCDLLQPTIVSKIIDEGVQAQQLSVVIHYALVMLGVTAIGAIGAVGRNQLASRVSQKFGADLRLDMFKKINRYSYEELGRRDAAGLLTRMTNDATQVQQFANGMMRIFAKAPILGIGALVMVFFLNARLALIMVVVVPVVVVLIVTSLKVGSPYFVKMQRALDGLNAAVREYLSGVRVVKAFNTFKQEQKRFEGVNENLARISIRVERVMSVFSPAITLIVNMSIVVLLWMAPGMIQTGDMKVGEVIAFMNYMSQILMALTMIFNVYQQFVRARASAGRIGDVLGNDGHGELHGEHRADEIEGRITFQNVRFCYPDTDVATLHDISFEAQPGETIGIIGSTGSGKSTLVNLIPGFYHPAEGEVLLDGCSLRDYDLTRLREQLSIVPQKAQLFTGTIAENIRWGKMDATDEEIVEAAKAAQAHDFIMSFPEGYNTFLGQNGVNLSGGQKQRVSIARALVRRSTVLILDDCVSAVDIATEAAIMKALRKRAEGVTCLMVTQRISSVLHLHKVLVLDNGALVGIGDHAHLMAHCEVYREIYRSQVGKLSGAAVWEGGVAHE